MDRIDTLERALSRLVERGVPGCACQVRRERKVIYEGYAGYADMEKGEKLTRNTLYRIFSMTKLYTCAAVLKLASEGRLSIEDQVSKYFPEYNCLYIWDGQKKIPCQIPLTVRHLLTMTAGIPYNGKEGSYSARGLEKELDELKRQYPGDTYSARELARRIAKVPIEFRPGDGWVYGLGHDILGALVEEISEKRFGDYLSEIIWEPLGLKNTFFRLNEIQKKRLSVLYGYDKTKGYTLDESRDGCYHEDAVFESGGGGIVSSLDDYGMFADMLCHNRMGDRHFLDPSLYEEFIRNQLKPPVLRQFPFSGEGYGLGVRVSLNGMREFGWYGVSGSWCLINPDRGLTIVYMQQVIPSDVEKILPYIRKCVYAL